MFELAKIIGMSAVLSAGLVTASEVSLPASSEPASAKIYTERLTQTDGVSMRGAAMAATFTAAAEREATGTVKGAKSDSLRKEPAGHCATQAWPHITPDCIASDGTGSRKSVRTITIEQREGSNVSVLVRVPAPEVASR
jgi:hypothetical protein